jgi:hypothetical protein
MDLSGVGLVAWRLLRRVSAVKQLKVHLLSEFHCILQRFFPRAVEQHRRIHQLVECRV